jgi:EmrB/QacA subfamily drug resistance transporter
VSDGPGRRAAVGSAPTDGSRRWASLAAICAAAGLVWLAFADLGVAIPTIADELHADLGALQWANNAFSLVAGALVIAAGRFGDIFGRRLVLQIGVVVFAGCSIVAAVAPDVAVLIVGRGLMGAGAALILPATLALIPVEFTGTAQLTAFGIWQAVAWGGQAIGPAIGGVLTDTIGWRWLFWLNLPIAVAAVAVNRAVTAESKDPGASRHIDWAGLAAIGLAVFALLFALTDGPSVGWGDPLIVGLLVAAVVLAVLWVLIERHVSDPLVDLALFRLRPYDGALTANLTMNLAFGGLSYLLVLWLQNARGYDAVQAGLLMLPSTLGIFVFIPLGGRLDERRGGKLPVVTGLFVMAVGCAVLGLLDDSSTMLILAVALVVIGIGLGLLSTPVSNTAVGDVPAELAGAAAGLFKMSSMVGGALGVAVLTAFARGFTGRGGEAAAKAAGLTPSEISQAQNALVASKSFDEALSKLPGDLAHKVSEASITAFTTGVGRTMVATAVILAVAVVAVLGIWPTRPRAAAPGPARPSTTGRTES